MAAGRGHYGMHTLRVALLFLVLPLAACERDPPFDVARNGDTVVGTVRTVRLEQPTAALDLAQRYSVGLAELQRANPKVRGMRGGTVPEGAEVILPTQYILPDAPRRGIVINLAERRLFYFPGDGEDEPREVVAFAAAVGRDEWETPVGETRVAERIVDPPWHPPASIRAEHEEEHGIPLPQVIPPGPDNPLGKYALRLGWNKHLIHGTNAPASIGQRASHGCVRLYPRDMAWLFEEVREGTPVRLVDQPLKMGMRDGALYVESHSPISAPELRQRAAQRIEAWASRKHGRRIDPDAVKRALSAPTGLPVRVSLPER